MVVMEIMLFAIGLVALHAGLIFVPVKPLGKMINIDV